MHLDGRCLIEILERFIEKNETGLYVASNSASFTVDEPS